MSCPYCGKDNYVPDYVVGNIEAYGSKTIRFGCKHCNKVVKAYGRRTVEIDNARTTNEESDW